MEMRQILAQELEMLMKSNENIVILNADLAKPNGLGGLIQRYPDRVFNVGIAEQNMASVAAGMSSYGLIPFIVTFAPFATRRICDQIAVSICYAKQNVKIIGSDPGITAELNGGTHMSMEDIGVLRSIPEMTIFEPVDNIQLKKALPQIIDKPGPVYIRMLRKTATDIFSEEYEFNLSKASVIRKGNDITIFCSGIMVEEAIKAAKILSEENISAEVINIHTIKPIDRETILQSVKKTRCAVTAENHNIIGGLYSAVCEVLSENCPVPLKPIGVRDKFGQVGKLSELKEAYKMRAQDIIKAAKEVLQTVI
jgi:Transketolase, C-terminal subunit